MPYQFNNREVNEDHYQVKYQGKALPVEPKVFDLILYLIKHRDRIVSRDELFEKIWAGRSVSDTSLSNHIKSARKALGDNGDLQGVIKTVRSRGYQFIATIEEPITTITETKRHTPIGEHSTLKVKVSNDEHSKVGEHSHTKNSILHLHLNTKILILVPLLLLLFVAIWQLTSVEETLVQTPYVLVVPFSISSNNTDNWQAFADQMTREMIQNLRKVSELKVVPPPSSFAFKSNKIRHHIKSQLPTVTHVIDGVISEGENGHLMLTVELENLSTGELLWDNDFDIQKNNKNLFKVQSDIASSVSHSLKVVMLDDEKHILAQAPTVSLKAYDYYVQGQYQLSLMTHQSVLNSIKLFDQAIALDQKFEQAYIGKSNAYRIIMILFDKPNEVLPKVISSAIDVLSINPNSAQVMSHLGLAYVHTWQWNDAWKMLSMAKQKDPSLALTELGFALYYSALGDIEGITRSLERANALDPLNEEIAEWGMWALMMTNQVDAAITWGEEKNKYHANIPYIWLGLSVAEYIKGNYHKSVSLAAKGVELSNREGLPLIIFAQANAAAGDKVKARALVEEAQGNDSYLCPYEAAITYVLLDEPEPVFPLLDKAMNYQSNCLIFTRNDPRWKQIRKDNRFEDILRKLGLDDISVESYTR